MDHYFVGANEKVGKNTKSGSMYQQCPKWNTPDRIFSKP
jgi:hypothetical protein